MNRGFFEMAVMEIKLDDFTAYLKQHFPCVTIFCLEYKQYSHNNIRSTPCSYEFDLLSYENFNKAGIDCCVCTFDITIDGAKKRVSARFYKGVAGYINLEMGLHTLDFEQRSRLNVIGKHFFLGIANSNKKMFIASDNDDEYSVSIDDNLCTTGFKAYYTKLEEDPMVSLTTMIVKKDDFHLFEQDIIAENVPVIEIDREFLEIQFGVARHYSRYEHYQTIAK